MSITSAFDRTRPPPPAKWLLREAAAFLFDRPPPPDIMGLPPGDGRSVLVIPAFLTTDLVTLPLRRFLRRCGWHAVGWGLGVNWGPTPRLRDGLRHRLHQLARRDGQPVAVVGVSLGGLLACDLAHDCPRQIRRLVTVASPVVLPTATHLAPLFHLLARFYSRDLDLARLSQPPPVRLLAIYSRDDGLVEWQSCFRPDAPQAEVRGAHLSICRNAAVLRLVAEALGATPAPDSPARPARE